MSSALLNPIPDLPALRVACVMLVLCEAQEEPFRGTALPDVVDLCSTLFLFLQDWCGGEPARCG